MPKPLRAIDDIVEECIRDSIGWFPEHASDLSFLALCLGGETGEFQNIVKKIVRGSVTYEEVREQLAEEAIDVFIYLCNIFAVMNIDVAQAYNNKREINERRFGHHE